MRVGVFDSGLGGLTIAKTILRHSVGLDIIYLADTLNAPYGDKTTDEILRHSIDITQFLLKNYHIEALVVACNTATSAAIESLRELYPRLIIIGTEPALKPAFNISKTKRIGVLATFATLNGDKYRYLVNQLSIDNDAMVYEQPCIGLVEQIELGEIDTPKTMQMLEGYLSVMRDSGVDTIVLGCTHYPLITDSIREIFQREIAFTDSAMGVTNRLNAMLMQYNKMHKNEPSKIEILSTSTISKNMVESIVGESLNIKMVKLQD